MSYFVTVCSTFSTIKVKKLKKKKISSHFLRPFQQKTKGRIFLQFLSSVKKSGKHSKRELFCYLENRVILVGK